MRLLRLILVLATLVTARPDKWVDEVNGDNSNPGTEAEPWETITFATANAASGEKVWIEPATYTGIFTETTHSVTYIATGPGVIIDGGFIVNGATNCGFIKLEITQSVDPGSTSAGIYLLDAHYTKILYNYIHDTWGSDKGIGIFSPSTDPSHYCTVRSNRLFRIGVNGNAEGNTGINIFGTNNLVEYCHTSYSADYTLFNGDNVISRNHFWDIQLPSYFPSITHHEDGEQYFPTTGYNRRRTVLENTLMLSNLWDDAHFIIDQNTATNIAQNRIVRGSVIARHGVGAIIINPYTSLWLYQNTLVDMNLTGAPNTIGITVGERDGFHSTNVHIWNNILAHGVRTAYDFESPGAQEGKYADFNVRYAIQFPLTEPNGLTSNPLFVDTNALNYWLQSGSPALGVARGITFADGAGTGATSLVLSNSYVFSDGNGITRGDHIYINGSAGITLITAIDDGTRTATITPARTWTNNAPIFRATPNGTVLTQLGALPVAPSALDIDATITESPSGTWTVTYTGAEARMCIFSVNSVPQNPVMAPDTFVYVGTPGETVTAKVFPWFPSDVLAYDAVAPEAPSAVAISGGVTISNGVTIQ